MTLKLYKMTGTPNWSDRTIAIVAAPDEKQAKACMSSGSDSCWIEVLTCEFVCERYFIEGQLDGKFRHGESFIIE